MNIPQPLVYFQSDSAFKTYQNDGYTARLNNLAVFVGETKKIYTHGEVFDCNNTVYNDTELRGLISGVDDKIDSSVETLTGLIDGVNDDLDNINNWSESDIRSSINTMMSEANWINNFISTNNIQTGTPFTITDVDNRLKTVGVLNNDGTLGWSTLQQNYNTISGTVNSLSTRVSDLETGGVDEEALQARLEGYIDDEIAGLNLDTTYARLDDTAIDWLRSGFSAQTSPELTFSQMYSAATKDWSGDIATATVGVKTEIENELDGYVATAELATKVENEGFAKTSGVVAKSDLDSSVAALFSSTSSTKTALDNKGYLTSSDLDGYATESYVTSAGFVTSSDLQSAQATMTATATNNATAAVSAEVANQLSTVSISADKITLAGTTWADTIFADWITANGVKAKELHTSGTGLWGLYSIDIEDCIRIEDKESRYYDPKIVLIGALGGVLVFREDNTTNRLTKVDLEEVSVLYETNINDQLHYEMRKARLTPGAISLEEEDGHTYINRQGMSFSDDPNDGRFTVNGNFDIKAGTVIGEEDTTSEDFGYVRILPHNISITTDEDAGPVIDISPNGITTPAINLQNPTYKSLGVFADSSGINMRSTSGDVKLDMLVDPSAGYSYKNIIDGSGIEFKYNNTSTLRMDSSDGSITVKNSSPEEIKIEYNKIVVKNNYSSSSYTITSSGASQGSDRTLKDIVSDVNLTVEQVAEAPAVEFTWKNDQSENKQHNVGTIAQYWQVVLPEVVGETEDGKLTMQYSNAAMVSAIVTAKEVVALKEEIAELKRQIAELKNN